MGKLPGEHVGEFPGYTTVLVAGRDQGIKTPPEREIWLDRHSMLPQPLHVFVCTNNTSEPVYFTQNGREGSVGLVLDRTAPGYSVGDAMNHGITGKILPAKPNYPSERCEEIFVRVWGNHPNVANSTTISFYVVHSYPVSAANYTLYFQSEEITSVSPTTTSGTIAGTPGSSSRTSSDYIISLAVVPIVVVIVAGFVIAVLVVLLWRVSNKLKTTNDPRGSPTQIV